MSRFDEKSTGVLTSLDFKKKSIRVLYAAMIAALIIISMICIFPPIWIFLSCFKDMKEFLSIPPTIIPKTFNLRKIPEVWKLLNFGRFYVNTMVLVLGDWLFCITLNGLAGYVLSRLNPKGSKLIMTMIFWTMLLPTSVNMVPLFMTIVNFPLLNISLMNSYVPMWLMSGANAFYVLLFRSFFNSIPTSYMEAARIDGCTNLGIFTKIMLPLSKPIVMVVSIFSITSSWESFLWPYLIIKDEGMSTVAMQVFRLAQNGFATDKYMVVLMFCVIPPAVIFVLFSKYIMQGANMSGIKG